MLRWPIIGLRVAVIVVGGWLGGNLTAAFVATSAGMTVSEASPLEPGVETVGTYVAAARPLDSISLPSGRVVNLTPVDRPADFSDAEKKSSAPAENRPRRPPPTSCDVSSSDRKFAAVSLFLAASEEVAGCCENVVQSSESFEDPCCLDEGPK